MIIETRETRDPRLLNDCGHQRALVEAVHDSETLTPRIHRRVLSRPTLIELGSREARKMLFEQTGVLARHIRARLLAFDDRPDPAHTDGAPARVLQLPEIMWERVR